MALKRIQDLTVAAALTGTELLELEQTGASVQCTTQEIADLASAAPQTIITLSEVAEPAAPAADSIELYAVDRDGVTQLELKDSTGLVHPISGELLTRVRNSTGSTLARGAAVYISGSVGQSPTAALAKADLAATTPCAGLVVEDIPNNGFGRVVLDGLLLDFDTSAFTEGDVVWLSAATAGGLTATKPTTPNLAQKIGIVTNSSPVSGSVLVAIGPVEAARSLQPIAIACSDETTALTTGTAKATFRMPYAFTVTAVRASVTTAPTGSVLTVDINEAGVSILSTKLTIDATEKTSTTAAAPAVISDTALADDAEITIDIDTVGSTVAGAGLKVWLIGYAA